MKKLISIIVIIAFILMLLSVTCNAADIINEVKAETSVTGTLIEIKDQELKTLDEYKAAYDSDTYGFTAYLLNKVRIFSIPLFFIILVLAGTYQYAMGIRKLDVRDKGYGMIIGSVTLLVICQILPLIFTIVVKGWRG